MLPVGDPIFGNVFHCVLLTWMLRNMQNINKEREIQEGYAVESDRAHGVQNLNSLS